MFSRKKSKSITKEELSNYSMKLDRKKKSRDSNYSAEFLFRNSSSSESIDNIIGQKAFSLDRNVPKIDEKAQVKTKRASWFLREKNRDQSASKGGRFFKRASLDYTFGCSEKSEEKQRLKTKIQRQNAADYTGDSTSTQYDENTGPFKKTGLSKFSLGKKFLKGEIGIRSFNYYLLKESLKKSQDKKKENVIDSKPPYKSKSDENIYEEIYFRSDHQITSIKSFKPPELPKPNCDKLSSNFFKSKSVENNSDNCFQEVEIEKKSTNIGTKGEVEKNMLQFESYISCSKELDPQYDKIFQKNQLPKFSSSSDSMREKKFHQNNDFYERPEFDTHLQQSVCSDSQLIMFKTDSSNSIRSENSLGNFRKTGSQNLNPRNKNFLMVIIYIEKFF